MKKLMSLAVLSALTFTLCAQEASQAEDANAAAKSDRSADSSMWPAYLAVAQWPRSADVIGLRLTIPFSTTQENVSGIDVGLWGKSLYFEGIQVNVLRNDVLDGAAGFQIGLYNSVGRGDMLGIQAGLFNEAASFRGVQAGLINVVGEGQGLQVGVVNRAETFYGYQVGVINIIRDAEYQFLPLMNIGF